jgi:hypothetical protein
MLLSIVQIPKSCAKKIVFQSALETVPEEENAFLMENVGVTLFFQEMNVKFLMAVGICQHNYVLI